MVVLILVFVFFFTL